jgi:hypothetical protein
MAKLVIECTPDTEHLEQVIRMIGRHLTALANDLESLRTGNKMAEPKEMYRGQDLKDEGTTPC